MLEYAVRIGYTSATERRRRKEVRTEDVIPLLPDVYGVCRKGHAARSDSGPAGPLEMAGSAATGARRRRRISAVRMVCDVFPVSVSNHAVVGAKPSLFSLHEDGWDSVSRGNEAAVRVEDWFAA